MTPRKPSAMFTGPVMVHDNDGDGAVSAMDDITFEVSASVPKPMVGLRCYQPGGFVFDSYVGYWPDYMFAPYFTLGSDKWNRGVPATCYARLFTYDSRGREKSLAPTITFEVGPMTMLE